jgi:hypothetical protein
VCEISLLPKGWLLQVKCELLFTLSSCWAGEIACSFRVPSIWGSWTDGAGETERERDKKNNAKTKPSKRIGQSSILVFRW